MKALTECRHCACLCMLGEEGIAAQADTPQLVKDMLFMMKGR